MTDPTPRSLVPPTQVTLSRKPYHRKTQLKTKIETPQIGVRWERVGGQLVEVKIYGKSKVVR